MKRVFTFLLGIVAFFAATDFAFGTVRTGAAYTTSGNTDNRPFHWRRQFELLDPDLAPFTHLLMKLEKMEVTDPKYHHFEDDDTPMWSQVNFAAGYSAVDTSVVVDDGTVFGTNFRIINTRTGEVLLVTNVSSNTLTVTRGYNSSTAAIINDNDYFLVFGELIYEGGDIGSIRTYVPTTVYNYTEIFRKAYGYTNTDAHKATRGPNDPERDRMMALRDVKKQMEYALRFGVRNETGSGATLQRHTGGLEVNVTTNVFYANGALSEPFLLEVAEQVYRYGSKQKLWLCGRQARKDLAALGLDFVRVAGSAENNQLGIDIELLVTPFGTARFVTDHTLGFGYADRIHIVDIEHANYASYRPLRHLANRQGNGEDQVKNEFLAEGGLWLRTEKAHGIVKQTTLAL